MVLTIGGRALGLTPVPLTFGDLVALKRDHGVTQSRLAAGLDDPEAILIALAYRLRKLDPTVTVDEVAALPLDQAIEALLAVSGAEPIDRPTLSASTSSAGPTGGGRESSTA